MYNPDSAMKNETHSLILFLCISSARTDSGLCMYHLFVWSYLNFSHNSQWITFPTQSSLLLTSLYANLLYSLFMWLIVSHLSPRNLYLLFCCVFFYSCFDIVLMALFCAVVRRDSVSLLRFSFLCHVHVFSWKISFVCLWLEMCIQLFFFLFLFPGYFGSVGACVVCIVSGGCNQSSQPLFYVIFWSLY